MRKLSLIAVFCVFAGAAAAQELRIVNAASLSSVSLAPGSIFTIFGNNLTNGVANASNVQTPPTTLGGVTVAIGGSAASLFYVSPTQINGVVNPSTPAGTQSVVITSARGTQTGSVTVATIAPPGLFSMFGTGSRDGAVLNAITFLLGDFSTRTANSPTYLALFATGLNLSITPTVTIGGIPVEVVFFGAAPCCMGLQQINVMLTDSLAGAGRVPVVVMSGGQTSNTVQVVLLPPPGAKQFDDDEDNKTRSRELASLAYVPGTSLVLVTDENDDVVRVVDVEARKVTRVIALHDDAKPVGIAVNAAGTLAVVAEVGRGKVAIIDLKTFTVTAEISTGAGPVSVAIAGSQAVVVNQDNDTVSIVDLTTGAVQKTLAVGDGPETVAVDAATRMAFVTDGNDGTVSVINLATLAVANTFTLGAAVRPHGIALITGAGVALVTAPSAGPDGTAILLNLVTGATISTIKANPERSGGSTAVAYFNSKVYFANQTGGSVSVLPVNPATGAATGPLTTIKVDLGARALAIDTKDNLLVVSNEGSGTLVLVNLATNTVVGRINAVRTNLPGDTGKNDRSDRDEASNLPAVQSITPASGRAGATIIVTITGVSLTGATAVTFDSPGGNDKGKDKDEDKDDKKGSDSFAATNVQVAAGGTRITATVSIPAGAKPGARVVRVKTANGTSSGKGEGAAMFVVMP